MVVHLKVVLVATLAVLACWLFPRNAVPVDAVPVLESFLEVAGGIYSVLAAFVIFVVWEQFNSLQKLTVREGSLAAEVPRLAAQLGEDGNEIRRRITVAMRGYLEAASAEWEDLAQLNESRRAVKALDIVETRVAELATLGDGAAALRGRLVDALGVLRECRVSRISAAKHRMPATLSHLLTLLSVLLLAALLAIPTGTAPAIGLLAFAALASVFTMIRAVVWDMDHPFVGVWNVSRAPFEDASKPSA